MPLPFCKPTPLLVIEKFTLSISAVGFDQQFAIPFNLGKSVGICILDHWLQEHGGNKCVMQFRVDRNIPLDPSRISLVLHGQIDLDEFHLFAERNQLHISALQGDTQQAAELFKHGIGRIHVRAHQAGDAVHGIEEEVRIELHAQRRELGVCQLHFQLGRGIFLSAKPLVIVDAAEEKKGAPKR